MNARNLLPYAWKIPLSGVTFTIGVVAGGMVPALLGTPTPPLPEGVDMSTLFMYYLLGNLILSIAASFIARGVNGGFLARWLILGIFIWLAQVTMFIDASIYMAADGTGGASTALFNTLSSFLPSFLGAALLALLFRSKYKRNDFMEHAERFLAGRSSRSWVGRIGLALVAYPLIYIFFGLLVIPFTYSFYAQGSFGLSAPTWGQIVPVQIARSVLLLVAALPILVTWKGSGRGLYLSGCIRDFVARKLRGSCR